MKLIQVLFILLLTVASTQAQAAQEPQKVSFQTIKGEMQVLVGDDLAFEITAQGFQLFSKDLYVWVPSSQEKESEWVISGGADVDIQGDAKGLVIDMPSTGLVIDLPSSGLVIDMPSTGLVIDITSAGFKAWGVSPKGMVEGDHVTFKPGLTDLSLTLTDASNQPLAVQSEIAKKTGISYPTLQVTAANVQKKTSISMPTLQRFTAIGPQNGLYLHNTNIINAIFDARPGEGFWSPANGKAIFDSMPGKGISFIHIVACNITVFEVYEDEKENQGANFLTIEDSEIKSFLNFGTIFKLKFLNTAISQFENKGTIKCIKWDDLGHSK